MRILTGIQPSGNLHIGNYFGAMRPCIDMQEKGETFLFIADYHALTQLPEAQTLRDAVLDVAIDWLACGINCEKTVFFRQSDVPQVTELTWILSCSAPKGLLERCTSYKDKIANGLTPNHGLFSYPVLMAADILLYGSQIVPVGKDQKQHLEVTRDVAIRFNNTYGDILVIPEGLIQDQVAVIPGTDGRKMSKSYDNTIPVFGAEKKVRKRIMKIQTDSTPVEDPKDPDSCNVFALCKLFASPEQLADLRSQYEAGGMGYGHAKQALFEMYWEHFRPYRERRQDLTDNLDYVHQVLRDGAARAREVADATIQTVSTAVGLR